MTVHPPLDLRLVPAALAAWAGAALLVSLPVRLEVAAAAVAGGGALLALAVPRVRSARVAGQVVLVGLVLATVLAAGAVQLGVRARGGIADLARERASVHVEGTVHTAPVLLRSAWPGAAPRYRTVLDVGVVQARGATATTAAPLVVVGPASWADAAVGQRVAVAGRLAASDAGGRAVAVLLTSSPPDPVARAPALLRGTARIRAGLVEVAAGLPGDAGALLPGVAVGDTSALPTDLADAMRAAGLTHLTAVSGAHFSLVGAVVLAGTALLGAPRVVRVVVTATVLVGFVVLVQPGPSVLRAAATGAVGLVGLAVGRPARALPALATAVVVLLVVDPWLAREVGFALSVLATAGLVLLAGPLAARWSRHGRTTAAHALAAPFAAQSLCAPVLLLLTPSVSAYAVPANLLVAPVVAPTTVLGLAAALVAPAWTQGATVLAWAAGAGCWWIGAVARVTERLPGSRVAWVGGPVGALLLALATLALLVLLLRAPSRTTTWAAGSEPAGAARATVAEGTARRRSVAGWTRASFSACDRQELPWRGRIDGHRVGRGRAGPGGARGGG
ncbi:ComEC/Rec2 family competence protein [Cellulomonas sp. P22]|uniref:ComEC/Rec2 family competence protein n=1 Tax=Cellulomonas sp. P22 TaxID=3373189 RepID=UPI0037A00F77